MSSDSYFRKRNAMAKSATDKIRELDARRSKLIAGAKSEALKHVQEALKELNSLGFNYRLIGNGISRVSARTSKTGGGKGRVKSGPCKICSFATIPPHDARTHRAQAKKAPFTNQDLTQRGLRRG